MTTAVARILEGLRDIGGLKGADIANIVDVSPPTVSRWSHGKGSPTLHTQTVIADLRYIVERLSDFYTPQEARLWLHTEHPLLGGKRAVDLVQARDTKAVLKAIDRLEAGAFV